MQLAILMPLLYGFFAPVAAGMAVIQDDECAARRAAPRDAAAARASTSGGSSWRSCSAPWPCWPSIVAAMIFFNHVLPNADAQEFRGPFHLLELPAAGPPLLAADDRLPRGASLR